MSRKAPTPPPPGPKPDPPPAPPGKKAASAFLEIDAALKAEIGHAQGMLERLQRAAELDPDDPDYMVKVDEIAAEVKATRAEEDKRKERLKMLARKKSPDDRWRARRLAEINTRRKKL